MDRFTITRALAGLLMAGSLAAAPAATPEEDLLPATATATTSFAAGLDAYQRGDFDSARRVFNALAALGDGLSMYNLGVMALRGEGTTADPGIAVGWWQAAAEAGQATAAPLLERFAPTLDDAGRMARDKVLGVYGNAALRASVLPDDDFPTCRTEASTEGPRLVKRARARFPPGVWRPEFDGFVLVDLRIGADGRASDPRVVVSIPARGPDARAFVAATKRNLLESTWAPRIADGVPVASRVLVNTRFHDWTGRGQAMTTPVLHQLRGLAERGNPEAGYVLGIAAYLDGTLDIPRATASQMVLRAAQAGVPEAQFSLATLTRSLDPRCPRPAKSLTWLSAAAGAGLQEARVALALERLRGQDPPLGQIQRWLAEAADEVDVPHVQRDMLAVFASAPEAALRDPARAAALARRYIPGQTGDPQDDEVLAAVAAAQGDFRGAAARQRKALAAARRLGWDTTVMLERLAAYEAGRAWHGDLLAPPVPSAGTGGAQQAAAARPRVPG